jgi:hypothetical protein
MVASISHGPRRKCRMPLRKFFGKSLHNCHEIFNIIKVISAKRDVVFGIQLDFKFQSIHKIYFASPALHIFAYNEANKLKLEASFLLVDLFYWRLIPNKRNGTSR